jgi:hypothetical protein
MNTSEEDAWINCETNDLWLFDKLILSRKLGYKCGPAGVPVPTPGNYIVRPVTNIIGMGKGASFKYIEHDTKDLPAGSFWCQIFEGRHLSVDYHYGSPILTVEGFRNPGDPLWKFSKWQKCAEHLFMPIELSLLRKFEYVNIEYIGKRVIEVHLRGNPDFVHGNTVAIPVWNDDDVDQPVSDELRYIDAPDYMRKGFLID